ncbi:MAG: protein kinase [Sphingomonas sp.]
MRITRRSIGRIDKDATGGLNGQTAEPGDYRPYKIADQITGDGETRGSSGQFGMVYFAKPVRGLGQPVAIKEFFPTNLVRRGRGNAVQPHDNASRKLFETGKAEFEREAEIVDALNHPNIVKILGFVEKNGTAYIISEWLDENLSEKVGKRGSEKFSPFSVDKMPAIPGSAVGRSRAYPLGLGAAPGHQARQYNVPRQGHPGLHRFSARPASSPPRRRSSLPLS